METSPSMQSELLSNFGQLGSPEQIRVVQFAKELAASSQSSQEIAGSTGKELLKFVGAISEDDLAVMETVVQEDCERIDSSEW